MPKVSFCQRAYHLNSLLPSSQGRVVPSCGSLLPLNWATVIKWQGQPMGVHLGRSEGSNVQEPTHLETQEQLFFMEKVTVTDKGGRFKMSLHLSTLSSDWS